jgi:hypothetical protein
LPKKLERGHPCPPKAHAPPDKHHIPLFVKSVRDAFYKEHAGRNARAPIYALFIKVFSYPRGFAQKSRKSDWSAIVPIANGARAT